MASMGHLNTIERAACCMYYVWQTSRCNPRARQFPGLINNQGERLNNNTEIDVFIFLLFSFGHSDDCPSPVYDLSGRSA